MLTSEEINRRLWEGATELRGSMDASRYKDYMLGLMFYKFLSDKTLETFRNATDLKEDDDILDEYAKAYEEYGDELKNMIQAILGYHVLPAYLYQTWIRDINSGNFEVQKVTDSLNNFERSIAVKNDSSDFQGLFANSTLDLSDTALGSNLNERSKNIKALIRLFEDLDMIALQKGDVLGDAYEYLIGQFAMESGKKAGEFYTPRQVSEVMAQIVVKSSNIKSIYDPTVGSGSLLLTVKKHLAIERQKILNYYGQEKNTATYNLTRMNLILHGIRPEYMTIRNADTLAKDWPEDPEHPDEGMQFDSVVMNPPYSVKNWNKTGLKVSDPRFEIAGTLPPDSKGDFSFLLHGLYHLGHNGTMAIVLPHGVLFRGSSEGEIRQRLLDKNFIEAVIGLPNNLFTNTSIAVCIIILKKNRSATDPVLIIDSSRNYIKVGKQNILQEKDIAKIVDTYINKKELPGYSHLATKEELLNNNYNLNIPRYVKTIDDEIPHNVDAHLFGGIPIENIKDLQILNSTVKDILDSSLNQIRDGYVELNQSIEELKQRVLLDQRIQLITSAIQEKTEKYIKKYWDELRKINKDTNLTSLKEQMLVDIKALLAEFDLVDIYAGYQCIAEIWKDTLMHDAELISSLGFYEAGRLREKNMVSKNKNQEGWVGAIVSNELIAKRLFADELNAIEYKKTRVAEIDNDLSELVETTKIEDSKENEALYDVLKKNEEGDPQDAFEGAKVKAEIKVTTRDSFKYNILMKIDALMTEKANINKAIKTEEATIRELIYNRISVLTNQEIDALVFEKWFENLTASMTNLIAAPLKKELETLEMLTNRYKSTLTSIEAEICDLEKTFEVLKSELVVFMNE
ncbi:MAG: type I restriction-modification system subunit M [Christensenellaceae bacterium]|jgi:type I restriction enzyme M protein|nr:type I restriction-modification system subunit M [Christensenellaceae bacterium]